MATAKPLTPKAPSTGLLTPADYAPRAPATYSNVQDQATKSALAGPMPNPSVGPQPIQGQPSTGPLPSLTTYTGAIQPAGTPGTVGTAGTAGTTGTTGTAFPSPATSPFLQKVTGGVQKVVSGEPFGEFAQLKAIHDRMGTSPEQRMREIQQLIERLEAQGYRNLNVKKLPDGTIVYPGQTVKAQGVSDEDVLSAMVSDRERLAGQMQRQMEYRKEGAQALRTAAGAAGAKAEAGAEEAAGRLTQMSGEMWAAQRTGLSGLKNQLQALTANVAARREEALADMNARMEAALEEFRNTTASQVEMQRSAVDANLQSQIQEIEMQARAKGIDPRSDPATREMIRRAKWSAFETLGNITSQIGTVYNQARSNLRGSYDQIASSMRQMQDSLLAGTETSAAEMSAQIEQMGQAFDQSRLSYELQVETGKQNIQLAADQLRLSGAGELADYLLNALEFFTPIADLVALAAMRYGEKADAQNKQMAIQELYSGVRRDYYNPHQIQGLWLGRR